MKIGYFADGPWANLALEKILDSGDISVEFICARYEEPDSFLRIVANEKEIPFLVHSNVNDDDFIHEIREFKCDLLISMSFNQIFRQDLINLTPYKIINCHAGKLPFYRGRNILNWVLINDENEFGITVHYIDSGVDTGDIILQKTFSINDSDDYNTLLQRAYVGCATLLYDAIKCIKKGKINRIKQDLIHPLGFYCSKRQDNDEIINWHSSSREVFNFVRALCRPGPVALTRFNGSEVRINKVEFILDAPIYKDIPGAVLFKEKEALLVKTLDSYVRVVDWMSDVNLRVGDRMV